MAPERAWGGCAEVGTAIKTKNANDAKLTEVLCIAVLQLLCST